MISLVVDIVGCHLWIFFLTTLLFLSWNFDYMYIKTCIYVWYVSYALVCIYCFKKINSVFQSISFDLSSSSLIFSSALSHLLLNSLVKFLISFFKDFIYLFETRRERERERMHKVREKQREDKQTSCWAGNPIWVLISGP